MSTTKSVEQIQFTPPQLLQMLVSGVSDEDPLELMDKAFMHINPGMLKYAISAAKTEFTQMNKRNDQKKLNAYLALGGDNFNQSFWNGCIAGLLWLQDYIDIAKDKFNIKSEEVNVCKQVLTRIGLPSTTDVTVEGTEGIKTTSNCKHYTAFLGSVASWSTDPVTKSKFKKPHTNMEMVRLLGATALNHFPSIPFAAYFIGQINNNNPMQCAEKLGKIINFNQYMTPQSVLLNEPHFIVQTDNSPIVGTMSSPLTNTVMGQTSALTGEFEWLGLFESTPEFETICRNNGFTSQEVKKYIFTIDKKQHEANVRRKDKIAVFVDSQHIAKQALDLRDEQLVQ